MKKSDAAGFICADCSNNDLGACDLEKAIYELKNSPWERELKEFERLDGRRPIPCWPDLTFRIGKNHISFMLGQTTETFNMEVCTPRPKKLLGFIAYPKFFEFKGISKSEAVEYLTQFYKITPENQYVYFKKLEKNS